MKEQDRSGARATTADFWPPLRCGAVGGDHCASNMGNTRGVAPSGPLQCGGCAGRYTTC